MDKGSPVPGERSVDIKRKDVVGLFPNTERKKWVPGDYWCSDSGRPPGVATHLIFGRLPIFRADQYLDSVLEVIPLYGEFEDHRIAYPLSEVRLLERGEKMPSFASVFFLGGSPRRYFQLIKPRPIYQMLISARVDS